MPCRSSRNLVVWTFLALSILGRSDSPAAEAEVAAPLPPQVAAETMQVPPGFHVELFAGEPDVRQPVSMCMDDSGRLWVAEAYNYPQHGTRPGDRIVVFADTNGDGKFDQRTVFYDQLNYVTGVEVGFGGAWVMSPPYFYFIPDRDSDLQPDGPAVTLLDGFGNHANAHNLANGFAWGPDGWLYGTHGRTNWSMIGKPGTPEDQRERFDGGVYRYHPVRQVWESFADGTTNPWGIDWNDLGDAFVCNCVTPHLYHIVPGAHYEPWRNRESSRYAYERISTIADHLHFIGSWDNARQGLGTPEEDRAGGGHAHCGTLIYQGGSWPEKYRNTIFLHNIHGHRINNDHLMPSGSGYIATHGEDFAKSQDPWYMGVNLLYGPDGSVYSSDWSDTGECHSVTQTRRETGRIFKISFGTPAFEPIHLAELDADRLVELHDHKNEWFVRHARRLLHERAARGDDLSDVRQQLRSQAADTSLAVPLRLRYLWTWYTIGQVESSFLIEQLNDPSEVLRGWAVRLLSQEQAANATLLSKWQAMSRDDNSPRVRLELASALQRLPPANRWEIARALAAHGEDQGDANLPLMVWYAIEPLIHDDLDRFSELSVTASIPLIRRHVARRCAEFNAAEGTFVGFQQVIARLADAQTPAIQSDVLQGVLAGLAGYRSVPPPPGWLPTYERLQATDDQAVPEAALELALLLDDVRAVDELRRRVGQRTVADDLRQRAVASLVAKGVAGLAELLQSQLDDPVTRGAAVRGLAQIDDALTPTLLLEHYTRFDDQVRQDALQTLSSRLDWARLLLDAVERHEIPKTDLTAYTVRQLSNFRNAQLTQRVAALWGGVRETPVERRRLIDQYKRRLSAANLAVADAMAGRRVFQKTCASCHRLYGEGGQIGPDITGAQRQNLDYLLENLIDPNAIVPHDYRMVVLETADGRVLSGLVVDETQAAVTLQTATEKIVVPSVEIANRSVSPLSMMPEGQLQSLTEPEVRDLIKYLTK